jgi:lipid II isoglutaminyl synthase (glutamine-hydrolysing)
MSHAAPPVRLCHLYPAEMNIYADRGNIAVFRQRLAWRGLSLDVHECGRGDPVIPGAHDLYYLGGGQDRDQALVADDLAGTKGQAVVSAVEDGAALLAVCGGYQLAGRGYVGVDGSSMPGIGLLDAETVAGPTRLIGDVLLDARLGGDTHEVAGFENHAGRTHLGSGATPFGRVIAGHGNDGESGYEGATRLRAIGTYLHGPLLPRNPWVADVLLAWALEHRTGAAVHLDPLDDALEAQARAVAAGRARGERGERLIGRRA